MSIQLFGKLPRPNAGQHLSSILGEIKRGITPENCFHAPLNRIVFSIAPRPNDRFEPGKPRTKQFLNFRMKKGHNLSKQEIDQLNDKHRESHARRANLLCGFIKQRRREKTVALFQRAKDPPLLKTRVKRFCQNLMPCKLAMRTLRPLHRHLDHRQRCHLPHPLESVSSNSGYLVRGRPLTPFSPIACPCPTACRDRRGAIRSPRRYC